MWILAIKKARGVINDVFFYVDRMESGNKVVDDLGLKSCSVILLDEYSWNYLRENAINKEIYNSIIKRKEYLEKVGNRDFKKTQRFWKT